MTFAGNLTLKGIERVWINLEEYLHGKDINYFSLDLGIAFLKERYQFTETPSLSSTNQCRLRAIQLLADFQTHQRILIRRKQRRYEFAQPFEKIFVEFMDFRKKAGISSKTLESYIIYLERFSQYLFNHEVNHVAEIDVEHIHGFIQSSGAVLFHFHNLLYMLSVTCFIPVFIQPESDYQRFIDCRSEHKM
jgi:hypothetical protein